MLNFYFYCSLKVYSEVLMAHCKPSQTTGRFLASSSTALKDQFDLDHYMPSIIPHVTRALLDRSVFCRCMDVIIF
jgi:hypothetical protein